jgi:hypothetical protein
MMFFYAFLSNFLKKKATKGARALIKKFSRKLFSPKLRLGDDQQKLHLQEFFFVLFLK